MQLRVHVTHSIFHSIASTKALRLLQAVFSPEMRFVSAISVAIQTRPFYGRNTYSVGVHTRTWAILNQK